MLFDDGVSHDLDFSSWVHNIVPTFSCGVQIVAHLILFYVYHIVNYHCIFRVGLQLSSINRTFSFI